MRPKEVIQTGHEPRKLRGRNSVLTGSSCQLGRGCAHENHYQLPERPDSGGAAAHSASIKGCRPFKRRKKLQHVQLMDTKLHVCLSLSLLLSLRLSLHFPCFLCPPPLPFCFPTSPLFSPFPPFFGFGRGGGANYS